MADEEGASAAARQLIAAFGDDRDAYNNYMNHLIDGYREERKDASRAILFIFLAIFLFEVLSSKGVKEAEVFAIKLSDFGLVRAAIPVVISASLLKLISTINELDLKRRLVVALAYERFGGSRTIDFYDVLMPEPGLVTILRSAGFQKRRKLGIVFGYGEVVSAVFIPVAFIVYAYWRLFDAGTPVPIVLLSIALSLALMSAFFVSFFDFDKDILPD
ncbi:hypothetical protein [Actinoplanes aureus]|uniref:Uncharacterized protein n=1 Tax=Actinoplanes aureus TaxID=2792083 RepID=A0A931C4C1_9ACTN|nr:hypothetical protein [Actinoplanes aureus]MBG0563180.1 hypothetical protein [Actinoplanes aureus]